MRDICRGDWRPLERELWHVLDCFQRVQLNFHAYTHLLSDDFMGEAKRQCNERGWQLIFQVDGVNDHLVSNAYDDGVNAVPLYDLSGGAGIVPESWPGQMGGIYSGYAGGLGPHNVLDELRRIENVATGDIWIDMERRVRVEDDSALDCAAVESVLSQVSGRVGLDSNYEWFPLTTVHQTMK